MMDAATLAAEADRLLRDSMLLRALASIRLEALEDLALADPSYPHDVIRHQERVRLCDEFLQTLRRHIEALPTEN